MIVPLDMETITDRMTNMRGSRVTEGSKRERRVAALEITNRPWRPVNVPMIATAIGETSDEAVERHVAEHGPLPEMDNDQVNVVVFIPPASLGDMA